MSGTLGAQDSDLGLCLFALKLRIFLDRTLFDCQLSSHCHRYVKNVYGREQRPDLLTLENRLQIATKSFLDDYCDRSMIQTNLGPNMTL